MNTVSTWLTPIWTLALAAVTAVVVRGRLRKPGRVLAAVLVIAGVLPLLPASTTPPPRKPATQVIYRFDDHRHLEMEGYACEGAIYYVDTRRGIRNAYIDQFGRVFLPRIIHADDDGDFIFMPYSDASGFAVSKDHGRTFEEGRWVGTRYFGVEEITVVTVVNQQAFIETKDGRLFMTSKPFGQGWGRNVIDPINELPTNVLDRRPEFKNLPKKVPKVQNYAGWTEMRCDPDLEGAPIETLGTRWNQLQAGVVDLLGDSVALPVTYAASLLR